MLILSVCVDPSEEAYLSLKAASVGNASERDAPAAVRVKSASSSATAAAGRSQAAASRAANQTAAAAPASNSVHWDRSRIHEELGRLDPHGMLLRVPESGVLLLLLRMLLLHWRRRQRVRFCSVAEVWRSEFH